MSDLYRVHVAFEGGEYHTCLVEATSEMWAEIAALDTLSITPDDVPATSVEYVSPGDGLPRDMEHGGGVVR